MTFIAQTLRAGAIAFVLSLAAGLVLGGCAQMTATDRAALHNAHVGSIVLRIVSAPVGDQPSYDAAWDGLAGTLGRLDVRFNGPEVATSTALMALPAE